MEEEISLGLGKPVTVCGSFYNDSFQLCYKGKNGSNIFDLTMIVGTAPMTVHLRCSDIGKRFSLNGKSFILVKVSDEQMTLMYLKEV